jgi:nucleoside-diphosphate-sugar epimerase
MYPDDGGDRMKVIILGGTNFRCDKLPVERAVLGDPDLPGTVLRLPMVHGPGDAFGRVFPYLMRMDDRRPSIVLDEGMARWKCPRGYVENVAATIALAVMDDRAASRIYNVAEPVAFTEAELVCAIGQVVGWRGEIVTVPSGRIPLSYGVEQSIDTDSCRIKRELGYAEAVGSRDGLERTVAWSGCRSDRDRSPAPFRAFVPDKKTPVGVEPTSTGLQPVAWPSGSSVVVANVLARN